MRPPVWLVLLATSACLAPVGDPNDPNQISIQRRGGTIIYSRGPAHYETLDQAVRGDAQAEALAATWVRRTRVGTWMTLVGGACSAFGAVSLVAHDRRTEDDQAWYAAPAWLAWTTAGCLGLTAAGVIVVGASAHYRMDAIEAWNASHDPDRPLDGTLDPVPRRTAWGFGR
jgi:hypothetical protein